jgi:hypothetical protein
VVMGRLRAQAAEEAVGLGRGGESYPEDGGARG